MTRQPVTIERVIDAIPAWSGRAISVEPVVGGLTNSNYRVVVDGLSNFVRIPGTATELLAVDRANELHNTLAAAAAGVGPPVVHTLPEWNVFVLEWLSARTMSNAALAAAGMPTRIAATLRRLHAGPRFRDHFEMVPLVRRYLAVVDDRAVPIPAGFRERLDELPRIDAALAVHPLPPVPCHNDLLAENYLDDGDRLWIVDWEYSGNGDPTFELGNTCQELGFDDERVAELCAAYFGAASPGLLARMRLQMILSDLGWTLWAAIQARISTIDYDFDGWADLRWARAKAMLDGAEYEGWLMTVATVRPPSSALERGGPPTAGSEGPAQPAGQAASGG